MTKKPYNYNTQALLTHKIIMPVMLCIGMSIMMLLPACRKKTTRHKNSSAAATNIHAEWKKLTASMLQPHTLKARGTISAKMPGFNQSFVADIRLVRDSLIWLSASASFGIKIEVARALITPDSIKILDKFNQQAYIKPISYLQEVAGYPLDFNTLQNTILGLPPLLNIPPLLAKTTANASPSTNRYDTQLQNLLQQVDITPQQHTISEIRFTDTQKQQTLLIQCYDYRPVEAQQLFAYKRLLETSPTPTETYKATVTFDKVEANITPLTFPFSIADTYEIIR